MLITVLEIVHKLISRIYIKKKKFYITKFVVVFLLITKLDSFKI